MIRVGQVTGAYGLEGAVKVTPLTDFQDRFDSGASLLLDGCAYEVEWSRESHPGLVVKLRGVDNRTMAELFRARYLEVPDEQAKSLLFGGGALILAPDGHLLGMPVKLLAGSPFPSFLVPGIILFVLIGIAPLLAAAITLRRHALAAVAVGLTLIGWVSVEMVVLAGLGSLAWTLYFVLGASIAAIGVGWWASSSKNGKHSAL